MTAVEIQAKHVELQAAMNRHLSHPSGEGALVGQHGILSSAISSAIADDDISSTIACVALSSAGPAIMGRETGAKARPAIIRTASSRRMVNLYLTVSPFARICGDSKLSLQNSGRPALIAVKLRPA